MAEAALDRGPEDRAWWLRAPDWLKAAVSATTALGVLTYAVLRVDYALFYDRFGLKPEDVGLGQAELISQSVAGVVLELLVWLFLLGLVAIVGWFVSVIAREVGRDVGETRRRSGTLAAIFLAAGVVGAFVGRPIGATAAGPWVLLAVCLVVPGYFWWYSRSDEPGDTLLFAGFGLALFGVSLAAGVSFQWTVIGVVVLALLGALGTRWADDVRFSEVIVAGLPPSPPLATPTTEASPVDEPPPVESRPEPRGRTPRTRRIIGVVAVAMAVALTETLLALSAVSDAHFVRTGHAVEPTLLGIPLVSWGARGADVVWNDEPPAGAAGHCFLYLGQGSGSVLLYDHDDRRTIRVPSGAVVLSIDPVADYQRVCPR